MASSTSSSSSPRQVPGRYGLTVIGALPDRLDFYYFQGQDKYFESRVDRYGSTVDPRVVALLDAKSFPVLLDVAKVEKKDLFTGTYMPPTSLTGGYRVCAYLDPSEPTHAKLKQLLFTLLLGRKDTVVPTFRSNFSALFANVESQLASGNKADFNKLNDVTSFDFVGVRPSATSGLGNGGGSAKASKWLLWQLHPLLTLGLPMIVAEPLLHTFHLPSFLVSRDYNALYDYFSTAASQALDTAETLGLSREEACHNLLFATTFNSYGGLKVLLPGLLANVARAGEKLHVRLAAEIRAAVAEAGGGKVTFAALEKMELAKSVVWESLRLDPLQYGRAKTDLQVESHDHWRSWHGFMAFI